MSDNIRLIQMNTYVPRAIEENKSKNWVLNGKDNSYFTYVLDCFNGSPTNSAIIDSYAKLIYGRGLHARNAQRNVADWVRFKQAVKEEDVRRICADFAMFNMASMQVIPAKGGGLGAIKHVPLNNVAPELEDEKGDINGYWVCADWKDQRKYKPENFPAFKDGTHPIEIKVIRPYKAGRRYFADPDYIAALPYCEMEAEIAKYCISHIKNGLSFGYIINIPDGNSLKDEDKDALEKKIKSKLTGSSNAGKFVLSFNGRDAEITVTPLTVNDAHKQWQYLTEESRQQIMTGHKVVSPMLFGVKDSTGFGNNADELDTAEAQLMKRVVQPKQNEIIDAFQEILQAYNLNLDLYFLPLTEAPSNVQLSAEPDPLQGVADALIELGEEISDEWEMIDNVPYSASGDITESELNVSFAFTPSSFPERDSQQDTTLFKVRYAYVGSDSSERDFCAKMMQANRVYRVEDIKAASKKAVNPGFGPNGSDTYDIFLYKGGVNCRHFFERRIYLKKDNTKISSAQARRLLNELDPAERKKAKFDQNPIEVAQIAGDNNNHWRLK